MPLGAPVPAVAEDRGLRLRGHAWSTIGYRLDLPAPELREGRRGFSLEDGLLLSTCDGRPLGETPVALEDCLERPAAADIVLVTDRGTMRLRVAPSGPR